MLKVNNLANARDGRKKLNRPTRYVFFNASATPFVQAYRWSAAGWGTRYANPASLPAQATYAAKANPQGDQVVFLHAVAAPWCAAYPWSDAGFGTRYANPATAITAVPNNVGWHPGGRFLAISVSGSPFVNVYNFSLTGFGTRVSNPASLPPGQAYDAKFSPDGRFLAVATGTSPFLEVYNWTAAGAFGTKVSAPSPLPTFGLGIEWHPNMEAIVLGANTTPFIHAYAWTGSGFGTKYSNPASLPGGATYEVRFSPRGNFLGATFFTGTPYIRVWPWSSATGFGVAVADPAAGLSTNARGLDWAGDQSAIFAGDNSTGVGIKAWPWSDTGGFGAAFSNPAGVTNGGSSVSVA
jgi:hypothetical protein